MNEGRQLDSRRIRAITWILLWTALVGAALTLRPPMPVDETRYLAVAWEMWLRGDFLVPHLNGAAYSHKPPLMFWVMQAGWTVFGVNDWWPRLVAPLFGLACLFLTARLAAVLWPEDGRPAALAPWLLLGSLFWAAYTTLTMFDTLLAAFALAGLLGVADAWRRGGRRGWLAAGGAVGLGVLAKGPVIVLFILPVAVSAPWWDAENRIGDRRGGWPAWFGGAALAVVIGAAIGLAWALPAAERGGEDYRNAILWGQTAGRVVDAFAHERPFWWYAALLPALCLPWITWPPLWRAVGSAWRQRGAGDSGIRLCLVWTLSAFVVLSLVSGKQPHYLLPLMPGLALLASRAFAGVDISALRWDGLVPAVVGLSVAALGGVLAIAPERFGLADWAAGVGPVLWTAPVVAGSVYLFRKGAAGVSAVAGFSVMIVIAVHGLARPGLERAYDLRQLAAAVGDLQGKGHPVAHDGKYHGQYQFLGRLEKPLPFVDCKTAPAWLKARPDGYLLAYRRTPASGVEPAYFQRFRGRYVGLWEGTRVLAHPDVFSCASQEAEPAAG